jgi:magnesium transporter
MSLDFGHRKRRRRARAAIPPAGSPPGTMMADPTASPPVMRLMAYSGSSLVERTLSSPDEFLPFIQTSGQEGQPREIAWLDVDGVVHAPTMARLGEVLQLHRLTLADIVNTRQRAKIEDFDGYIFIVVRMPSRNGCIETEQVSFCLGPTWVVTFQEHNRPGDSFEPVRDRLRHSSGRFRQFGPDYLAYALLDAVIDSYFPPLEDLGDQLDILEDAVLETFDAATSRRIHLIRRDLITIRRAVWPLREAMSSLIRDSSRLVCEETRVYLRDCYDHTVQIIDLAESYRDVGAGLMELYLTTVNNRMNEIIKVLTIIATIFGPLTFIVGVYGMNFDHMPELHWKYGYGLVWLVMLVIAGIMLIAFWRWGWFGGKPARRVPPQAPPPAPPRSPTTPKT